MKYFILIYDEDNKTAAQKYAYTIEELKEWYIDNYPNYFYKLYEFKSEGNWFGGL